MKWPGQVGNKRNKRQRRLPIPAPRSTPLRRLHDVPYHLREETLESFLLFRPRKRTVLDQSLLEEESLRIEENVAGGTGQRNGSKVGRV